MNVFVSTAICNAWTSTFITFRSITIAASLVRDCGRNKGGKKHLSFVVINTKKSDFEDLYASLKLIKKL